MAAPPDRARLVPLVLSGLALAASTYAALRPPPPPNGAASAAQIADLSRAQEELRRELVPLRAEVAELRLRAPAAASERVAAATAVPAAQAPTASAPPHGPEFVSYEVGNTALTLVPTGKGDVLIINTDPALTGKTVTVSAKRANGEVVKLEMKVPPPR